ncbi:restriction endonuclease subunit R [Helicobacter pylori]|uniref:restriction endonuclease subunit R n=1 Tax=Helicobacter pylori TaxID=210 RepID=UPI00112D7776|nr:restriction endonuclease subunit R [Helicobacter pylori]TPH94680.1 restriction endonuclease subunit R [Helicobacter pylori]
MQKLEKILLEITQLDPSKECLKFLANRIKSSDYRGLHLSQHNRYDQNKIKTIIQAIFNEVGEDLLQIRTTDMSKRPSNIIGEEVYAKVVDNICKSEMPQNNLGKKNQVTQDSLRKNLFVDMHRMGLIERYNKNKEPTNPYIQSNIKYISLTPLAIEFLNAQDLLRKNFCYTQALENLLKGFGAECREVMIELENHYLDIEEMMFFVTFLNIENFTRSEIIEYVREYRSLSRIQKEKLKELVQDYCNPNHFNGNKLDKRDYHNWKNQAQQIFSLLEQSVFFETNKERLILKTLNEENKQNDKKLKRSIKEKALYFEKHGVKKEKGFELHHIVPLCLARSIEEFDLLDKWENLIYIDAFNHAKISQTQNKHICLYFENCDVILSKGLKEEQESLYFTYIENVLYKLDLQNVMLKYNKDLLHSKNG